MIEQYLTMHPAGLRLVFDRTLRHRDGHLLDGPSPRFPEIQFIR